MAEAMRAALIEELSRGPVEEQPQASSTGRGSSALLEDLERDFEAFKEHDILRQVLDQGRPVSEFAADVDAQLHALETESIQDYISETDNLVQLHDEVCLSVLSSVLHKGSFCQAQRQPVLLGTTACRCHASTCQLGQAPGAARCAARQQTACRA